jgi:hypothetical protein
MKPLTYDTQFTLLAYGLLLAFGLGIWRDWLTPETAFNVGMGILAVHRLAYGFVHGWSPSAFLTGGTKVTNRKFVAPWVAIVCTPLLFYGLSVPHPLLGDAFQFDNWVLCSAAVFAMALMTVSEALVFLVAAFERLAEHATKDRS